MIVGALDTMRPGSVIGGRYRLDVLLGEGGMASVWGAVDETLDRPVALKFIYTQDPRRRERMVQNFLREARIAAAIRHRNVVQILDFGTSDEGTPYMVMERLDGRDLGVHLRRGPMPLDELVDIACGALEGLAAVHDAGIVHRDLKPENIFLVNDRSGVYPKLLDFGISRSVDLQSGRRSAIPTVQGTVVGTPHYMAPEQATGAGDADARADIYSVGVILYQALTGRLPYESDNVAEVLLLVVQLGNPPDVIELNPAVGQAMSDVVKRAMARDRDQRFASASAMQNALVQAAEGVLGAQTLRFGSVRPSTLRGRPDMALTMDAVSAQPIALTNQRPPIEWAGHGSLTSTLPAPPGLAAAGPAVSHMPAGPSIPPAAPVRRATTWVWGGLAACAVLGGLGYFVFNSLVRGAAAETGPRYIVVQGSSAPSDGSSGGSPRVAVSPTAEPEAPAVEEGARKPPRRAVVQSRGNASTKTRGARRRVPNARNVAASGPESNLARAFAEQTPQLVTCFHGTELNVPRVHIRFQIDVAGSVQEARILPEEVGASEIGRCLAGIARTTKFGPQPEPLSFTVPLTVRRQ